MAEAVLLFTFSPVQPFIMEARRATDLFAGSRILVELAKAAAIAVHDCGGQLVFPAELRDDVPNRLVATVPAERARQIADLAQQALLEKWGEIARSARARLLTYHPEQDQTWNGIWDRQVSRLWETYWAAAPIAGGPESYASAYRQADHALNAAKRTRVFDPAEEPGLKDSLSGRREALHTADTDARGYWARLGDAPGMTAAKLHPEGRERLDAIGATKRFSDLAGAQSFPSTSTAASEDFRERARGNLGPYRSAIEALIPQQKLYRVRSDPEWPYDGDLFYAETLTPQRLRASYGLADLDPGRQREAQEALGKLYHSAAGKPSPYYAVIVLDGDQMGKRIGQCLEDAEHALERHRKLSRDLTAFAERVPGIVRDAGGSLIYNGGDDVLLLAPLARAVPAASALAQAFRQSTGGTASAGIGVAHHLSPLDAALAAAREAEQAAKVRYDRDAVCVRALKRSGETLQVGSKWADAESGDAAALVHALVAHFQADRLASRFAYEVAEQAGVATALPQPEAREAMLRRLVLRHGTSKLDGIGRLALARDLHHWAEALNACVPPEDGEGRMVPQGLAELGRWLVLARFIAQGGAE